MFFANLRLSNRKIAFILLLFTAFVVLAVAVRIESFNKTSANGIECSDENDIREYIMSFGLELGNCTADEITIPQEFNDVYKNYNDIQKSQGFDLSEYKGVLVKRYTFNVLNHADGENVFAEVLLCDNVVIGADVYSTALDGFILPLK